MLNFWLSSRELASLNENVRYKWETGLKLEARVCWYLDGEEKVGKI